MTDEIKAIYKSIKSLRTIIEDFNNLEKIICSGEYIENSYIRERRDNYNNALKNLEYETGLLREYKNDYPELFI